MTGQPYIHITLTEQPAPEVYGRAVLACQQVLGLLGLGGIATVHPDARVVSDADLSTLWDRLADDDPWAG